MSAPVWFMLASFVFYAGASAYRLAYKPKSVAVKDSQSLRAGDTLAATPSTGGRE